MDAKRFDTLVKTFSTPDTRRGLLRVVAGVPLAGALAALFGGGLDVAAKQDPERGSAHRRKRRKAKHRHRTGQDKDNRKGKRKKKGKGKGQNPQPGSAQQPTCVPESQAQTCAGKCAQVRNNCGASVNCGPCACEPLCQVCQTCDASTGVCIPDPDAVDDECATCRTCDADGQCAAVVDNTPCDDGDACTQTDTCQGGACVGSNPVVCTAIDECHDIGACNQATGLCSNPNKANGTPCDDGDTCTLTDTCQNGTCVGSNPVVCNTPPGQCYRANGTCQPDGACAYDFKAQGAVCNDGNACTRTDVCDGDGTCIGSNPVVCQASDQCHVAGTCDSTTGQCSNPPANDGTSCDDGDACTQDDTCQNGVCTGNSVVCPAGEICCNGTCCSGCCGADGSCGACLVFVSSTTHAGNLGGLAGADAICQQRAQRAATPLPGTYKAWLSAGTGEGESPVTRFRQSALGYQRVDGVTVADSWADLIDETIANPINITEAGATVMANHYAWTNTLPDGTAGAFILTSDDDCANWTSSGHESGNFGELSATNFRWTTLGYAQCNTAFLLHLYCFQQQ